MKKLKPGTLAVFDTPINDKIWRIVYIGKKPYEWLGIIDNDKPGEEPEYFIEAHRLKIIKAVT